MKLQNTETTNRLNTLTQPNSGTAATITRNVPVNSRGRFSNPPWILISSRTGLST